MTDDKIIKALELCATLDSNNCKKCPCQEICNENDGTLTKSILDLISHLKKENDDLFYKLQGVMWSVDKWLDGKELEQDEVNRAITMREKTLQITEQQQSEIENLKKFCNDFSETLSKNHSRAETEKWQAVDEAIKEFAERLKEKSCTSLNQCGEMKPLIYFEDIDNLVKETVGTEE